MSVLDKLGSRFEYLKDGIKIQRERRTWVDVPLTSFFQVFDYAVKQLEFSFLCTITGLDEGADYGFIYHLANANGEMLNIKIKMPKEQKLKTVTDYFPSAAIYERELNDLLGVEVEGLPPGLRYPLPDDWPKGEYPLRKDWDVSRLEPLDSARGREQKNG
jgi:Ni,Fe-hydrogenase III component G